MFWLFKSKLFKYIIVQSFQEKQIESIQPFISLQLTHRIHGTGICNVPTFNHKKSAIHIGIDISVPWIVWEPSCSINLSSYIWPTHQERQVLTMQVVNHLRYDGISLTDWPNKTTLHPGRLTWNIMMEVWKIIFLSKWLISRFHVNLPGCSFGVLFDIVYRDVRMCP